MRMHPSVLTAVVVDDARLPSEPMVMPMRTSAKTLLINIESFLDECMKKRCRHASRAIRNTLHSVSSKSRRAKDQVKPRSCIAWGLGAGVAHGVRSRTPDAE